MGAAIEQTSLSAVLEPYGERSEALRSGIDTLLHESSNDRNIAGVEMNLSDGVCIQINEHTIPGDRKNILGQLGTESPCVRQAAGGPAVR
jgi:hypothetical protein